MDAISCPKKSVSFTYQYCLPNTKEEKNVSDSFQLPFDSNVTIRERAFLFLKDHKLPEHLFPDLLEKLESFITTQVDEIQCQNLSKRLTYKSKLHEKCHEFWTKLRNNSDTDSIIFHRSRKDIHPLEDNFHSMYHEVVHSGILTPQLIQLENHNSEVIRNLLSEREEYLQTLTQEQNQTIESILLSGAYTDKEINAITKNNILLTEKRCKEWRERISNVRNNQKREFCSWVKNTYEDWIRDSGRVNNSNLLNDTQKESNSPIGKDDFVEFIADDEIPMEESYTINLGSQLKTTHNLRLISVDILNFCNNRCTPHRLQTAMSLYSNSLTAIVLLQDKPIDQSHVRSEFGRLCQGTSENHFADYDVQLGDIISDIHRLKRKVKSDENVQLNIGDVFITKHSNFSEAHLVFHVVVDDSLKSPEINSRHPVILGIRNILKIAYIYDIAHISIPLLLLHHMNEDITIQWCLRRAELILKCVKGFMIEMSSLLSLNENENKTIQFVVPKDISHELFSSLSAIFPTVFRLSNTLFLTTSHV